MEEIIQAKLKEIEKKENVKIIMAVESGSRAWGFASKDSDYDARFVYVRRLEDYLKLENTRDVIEWLSSPIAYRDTAEFKELKEISHQYYSEKKTLSTKLCKF